jgi:outer membrane protein assembly factor BamB
MRNTLIPLTLLGLAISFGFCSRGHAQNWPQWRGPNLNGSTAVTATPATLDKQTLLWSVDLPGLGAGTPVIWGDRVFVSAIDGGSADLLGLCLDRNSGKVIWRKQIGTGFTRNQRNNYGSPSPITDGRSVFFHFGNGELAAVDLDGRPLWQRNIATDHGSLNLMFIYGSSPLLHQGRLFINVIHRNRSYNRNAPAGEGQSYVLAIDAATGKDLWKTPRITDARDETMEAYSTPMPVEVDGRTEIITVGADYVTAHDPQTGRELWRCGGWNPQRINHWRIVPSVVVADGLVIMCAPKGGPLLAIRPGGSGDVTNTHIAWRSTEASSDVCTPLVYRGNLYVLDGDRKTLTCVNPADGKARWSGSIGGNAVLRTSPTGADGKIYCMNEAGQAWVLSADEFRILSTIELSTSGPARASVAAAPGMVFIRTPDKLHCFGSR